MIFELFTDCPDRVREMLGEDGEWLPVSEQTLTSTQRAIWAEAAGNHPLWRRRGTAAAPPYWRHLNIVGEASRSQFDTTQEQLGSDAKPASPFASLALTGRGFHGQRGRRWTTRAGNLHLTAAVPINAPAAEVLPSLTMLPAVAAVQAIEEALGGRVRPTIKWVNDVLIDGRKVGGVLTATVCRQHTVESACFGIGINVAERPAVEPTLFVPAVGCLRDVEDGGAGSNTLGRLCRALLDALERAVSSLLSEGPAQLLAQYRDASVVVGRRVTVYRAESDGQTKAELGHPLAEGVVEAINADLTLLLRGNPEPVDSGRLVLEPQEGGAR